MLPRSDESSVCSSLPLPPCSLQLSRIRLPLKTVALFPYRRATRALLGIDLNRVRSWEVTTAKI